MGFHFGLANHLDPDISLYAFFVVILFLIFFEYVSGVIEFFLERSPLYNRMLQMMYKELMLMGLVSFSIIMFEATAGGIDAGSAIIAIDFAHILLFYLTLFFVVHAFFLMGISIVNERRYRKVYSEDLSILINKIQENSKNPIWNYFFQLESWPFSKIRQHVEFHLLNALFYNTYLLSETFDFATYLSNSFGRYALKSINRSLFSWVVLLIILVLNFTRIEIGYGCRANPNGGGDDNITLTATSCESYQVRLFVVAGIVYAVYVGIIIFVSHLYKKRMLQFGGIREPSEYLSFLEQRQHQIEEHKKNGHYDHNERFANAELKEEIEFEMHTTEHGEEEEEPEIKMIALTLVWLTKYLTETYSSIRLSIKVWLRGIFCNTKSDKKDQGSAGSMLLQIPLSRLPSVTRATITEPFHRMSSRMSSIGHGLASRQSSVSGKSLRSSFLSGGGGGMSRQQSMARESPKREKANDREEENEDGNNEGVGNDPSSTSGRHNKKRKSSFFEHASEFLRHPGDAIRKTRLPTFHLFHKLEEHEVKDVPLKHRLTFKFAKTAKSQSSVTQFHFQERMTVRNNTAMVGGDIEMGEGNSNLKEDALRSTSGTIAAAPLLSHRNTNSLKSIHRTSSVKSNTNQTAVTSEPAGDLSNHSDEENPSHKSTGNSLYVFFATCCGVAARFTTQLYSSLPKVMPLSAASSATSSTTVTPKNQSNKDSSSHMPTHQNQTDHLEKFKSSAEHMGHEFHSIFLFQKPIYYHRAVELTIFFNCLYMSIWATNMITIVDTAGYSKFWSYLVHIFIVLPIIWGFYGISLIAETSSMLIAMSELNLVVIHDVLVQMELIEYITEEVREQFVFIHNENFIHLSHEEFISNIFNEIDEDGSGFIDADELRSLLKKLQLTFSNYRFKLLYHVLDSCNKGKISKADLQSFIFPKDESKKTIPSFLMNHNSSSPPGFASPARIRSRGNSEDNINDSDGGGSSSNNLKVGNSPSTSSPFPAAAAPASPALIIANRRKRFSTIRVHQAPNVQQQQQQLHLQHLQHQQQMENQSMSSAGFSVNSSTTPTADAVTHFHVADMQVIREEEDEEEDDINSEKVKPSNLSRMRFESVDTDDGEEKEDERRLSVTRRTVLQNHHQRFQQQQQQQQQHRDPTTSHAGDGMSTLSLHSENLDLRDVVEDI